VKKEVEMDLTFFEMGMDFTILEMGMDYMELEKMVGTIVYLYSGSVVETIIPHPHHPGLQFIVELEFIVMGTIIPHHP
jgi:hypothetical protein